MLAEETRDVSSQHPRTMATFCLRGEIDGHPRTFPLRPGWSTLGSSRSCDVVLPTTGVSRRHARLWIEGEAVRVEDLASKNGTFVGGERISAAELQAGDPLRLGPVCLRFAPLDPDDGALGLILDSSTAASRGSLPFETSRLEEAPRIAAGNLDLVRAVVDYLTLADPNLQNALQRVCSGLGARGLALIDEPGGRTQVVLAAAGCLGPLPVAADLEALRADRQMRGLKTWRQGGVSAAVHRSRQGSALGLWLWEGEASCSGDPLPLLGTLLHLVRRLGAAAIEPPPAATIEPPAAVGLPALTFPEGVLPGRSPAMLALYQQMQRVAGSDLPVLLLGETGVGKEHLALTLHLSCERAAKTFLAVNCAAIPEQLLEAEMFGIGRGVASGVEARAGKFQHASGGTLFLDEVGDMPLALQAKLLRALEEGRVHPVGRPPVAVDVRVIAATNADLHQRLREGRFRSDLYFRLAGCELEVPPLRHRIEDLPPLVGCFLRRYKAEGGRLTGVSVKALRAMIDYDWPGNVRELEHEVRRWTHHAAAGQAIDSAMLSPRVLAGGSAPAAELDERGLGERLAGLETALIRAALLRKDGNQTRAAELLQVSRGSLIKRMKRLGIDPNRL